MGKISRSEIEKISSLAKLKLSDEELSQYEGEFNQILDYISQIQEVDVEGIEYHHNLPIDNLILREDRVIPFPNRDKLLKNVTDGRMKNGYIRTSKIVDKGE